MHRWGLVEEKTVLEGDGWLQYATFFVEALFKSTSISRKTCWRVLGVVPGHVVTRLTECASTQTNGYFEACKDLGLERDEVQWVMSCTKKNCGKFTDLNREMGLKS